MLHYIRDLQFTRRPASGYDGNLAISSYILYHFLRVMGWVWLWECDSKENAPNHCPDGDMEAVGVASWTVIGTATRVKDSGAKHQGFYSLKVTSAALNDGVRSALLTTMENTTVYRIALWAANNSGAAWNVDVDDGSGSFANVGTIPNNGGTWTLYHFTFTTNAGGNRYVRVVDNNATAGDIYLDDINVFRSWFEYNGVDQSGSDGDVQNGNEFSSGAYTFVAGDVGKLLVFYDPTNLGNSGAYLVGSINAGNAVLTLRMGGSETLIDTAVGTLVWRLLDLTVAPTSEDDGTSEAGCGWGLESPHASAWRLFFRNRATTSSTVKTIMTWSSPAGSDFSVMNGDFLTYEPSTRRPRGDAYDWTNINTIGGWFLTGHGGATATTHGRLYAMVASGGEFVAVALRSSPEATANAMGFFGITGSDARHTTRESFAHLARRDALSRTEAIGFATAVGFSYDGVCGTEEADMPTASIGLWNTDEATLLDSDAKANPFSGEEFLQRPLLLRDSGGIYGFYSEKEIDVEDSIWGCRANLSEWAPFSPVEGDQSGGGDGFSITGTTVTLTDTAGAFTADMVGREITIAGATSAGNDGTFVVTSRISATQITYENAAGVTEAGAGTWSVAPGYFHFKNGVCWKWPGFTAVA